ncbi:hypothetical protein SAMN02910369_01513 [Lachnospiraceae bacterium NE2001]|nr:hypothetical protein SAMN02910369_01513 [Lachnospiraceae bacterium NE2001]
MFRIKGILKRGLCLGLSLTLVLSCASCGKEEIVGDDYSAQSDKTTAESDSKSDSESDPVSDSGSDFENLDNAGRSLTEIFGENISATDGFNVGNVTVEYALDYKVPEVEKINLYEGNFIEDNSEIEKQIVSSFFGGTEQNLDEIKYVNETDYILLLYKYRSILDSASSGSSNGASSDGITLDIIDSSFEEVYTWVDESSYYIHMYEGEYNGTRFGMIYSYDKTSLKRNIYICPISIDEYFPDQDVKTMFVVDQDSDYGTNNVCTMSEADIESEASVVVAKLGLGEDDVKISFDPSMAPPDEDVFWANYENEAYNKMPKLVFSDSDIIFTVGKLNISNPAGRTYAYKILKEQPFEQQMGNGQSEDAILTENGYAVYFCSMPFSENVEPEAPSTFNRGSVLFTDKGLFLADISVITEMVDVVEGVSLLSFDEIKEHFKEALNNDPDISKKSSGSLDVISVSFTYVLIQDEESGKAKYVPAWYFITKDNKLKDGDQNVTYSHVISAIDGSDLKDMIR